MQLTLSGFGGHLIPGGQNPLPVLEACRQPWPCEEGRCRPVRTAFPLQQLRPISPEVC